jgi:hypothetical protein
MSFIFRRPPFFLLKIIGLGLEMVQFEFTNYVWPHFILFIVYNTIKSKKFCAAELMFGLFELRAGGQSSKKSGSWDLGSHTLFWRNLDIFD